MDQAVTSRLAELRLDAVRSGGALLIANVGTGIEDAGRLPGI